MRRRTTASALLAVALLAGGAAGQPPAVPPDPTDALIKKALANDPDVQVARAKLALAEAEVAKARQVTVGRVLALRDTVAQYQQSVKVLDEEASLAAMAAKNGGLGRDVVAQYQGKLAAARAVLARAETELRLLTGDGPKAAAMNATNTSATLAALLASGTDTDPQTVARARAYLSRSVDTKVSSGPIPDQIRAALDKRVRLGNKGDGIALDAAMVVFKKEAGLDVPIRPTPSPMPRIVLDGEELPIGAWFQMFQDHGGHRDGFAFYVRDYGLLVANRQTAPPDAMTLTEFWHTRLVAAKQPEPKQPDANVKWREFPHDKLPAVLKVKAGEGIAIPLPVKQAEVEDAKAGSDNPAIMPRIHGNEKTGSVTVMIYSERPGKARVTWDVTDATGRRFTERGREVEFE
ncbi:MAG TPA: hypothetical protein VD866_18825 [Urbifossiella sp.]|nr:hypothetical protein [Urbifossiella sp.]